MGMSTASATCEQCAGEGKNRSSLIGVLKNAVAAHKKANGLPSSKSNHRASGKFLEDLAKANCTRINAMIRKIPTILCLDLEKVADVVERVKLFDIYSEFAGTCLAELRDREHSGQIKFTVKENGYKLVITDITDKPNK